MNEPRMMGADVGNLDIEAIPTNAQSCLLRDEAIAAFTAKNHLREALSHQAGKMLAEGKDPSALIAAIERLCTLDAFTQDILKKML